MTDPARTALAELVAIEDSATAFHTLPLEMRLAIADRKVRAIEAAREALAAQPVPSEPPAATAEDCLAVAPAEPPALTDEELADCGLLSEIEPPAVEPAVSGSLEELFNDWRKARAVDGAKHMECTPMVAVGDRMRASLAAHAAEVARLKADVESLRGLDTPTRVRFYEHDFYPLSNFSVFVMPARSVMTSGPMSSACIWQISPRRQAV